MSTTNRPANQSTSQPCPDDEQEEESMNVQGELTSSRWSPIIAARSTTVSRFSFTLVFRGGATVVLLVHGAQGEEEARAFAASSVLPNATYEVRDSDETHGHGEPLHAWVGAQRSLYLSLQQAREQEQIRRHIRRIRERMRQNALQIWQNEESIGQLRKVPTHSLEISLSEATDAVLVQMVDRIHTVIWCLSTTDAGLPEEQRRQYLGEARAIADALKREQTCRLLERLAIALSQQQQKSRDEGAVE